MFSETVINVNDQSKYFTEKLQLNLSLIKKRIDTPKLRIDFFKVSNNTVSVAYLSGVSSYYTVRAIERRLDDIIVQPTDELQSYLIGNLNTKFDIFPLIRKTRREEWACKALYKGDVLIFIDDIPYCLVAPRTLWRSLLGVPGSLDCFNPYIFRIFVYIALFISLFLSSLYMVAVSYCLDWLSSEFSNYLNSIRGTVIFSAFIEVLILEFSAELIRESLLANPPRNGLAVLII